MWSSVVALDIETDTSGGGSSGLDPRRAEVVAVALADESGPRALTAQAFGGESGLLRELDRVMASTPPGLLVTWNGSGFDLPFLVSRAQVCGVHLGLRVWDDASLPVKYESPSGATPVVACWDSSGPVPHAHWDIAAAFKEYAARSSVAWSLKPVASSLGLSPVEVDRERVHELSSAELESYVASDAAVTRALAAMLLSQGVLLGTGAVADG